MKIVARIRVARVSSHAALLVDPLVIQRGIACERSTSAHSRVRRTRLPPSPQDGTFHCARCPCKSGRRNNTRQHSVMGHFPKHLPAVLPGTAGMAPQARMYLGSRCLQNSTSPSIEDSPAVHQRTMQGGWKQDSSSRALSKTPFWTNPATR